MVVVAATKDCPSLTAKNWLPRRWCPAAARLFDEPTTSFLGDYIDEWKVAAKTYIDEKHLSSRGSHGSLFNGNMFSRRANHVTHSIYTTLYYILSPADLRKKCRRRRHAAAAAGAEWPRNSKTLWATGFAYGPCFRCCHRRQKVWYYILTSSLSFL